VRRHGALAGAQHVCRQAARQLHLVLDRAVLRACAATATPCMRASASMAPPEK
jgi:hypothetical protein